MRVRVVEGPNGYVIDAVVNIAVFATLWFLEMWQLI